MYYLEIGAYIIAIVGPGWMIYRAIRFEIRLKKIMKYKEEQYAQIKKDAESGDLEVVDAAARRFIKELGKGPYE